MKTLLINNTADYHKGCVKVVEAIQKFYGFDDSIKTRDHHIDLENLDYTKYDRVILNGEGTMHHGSRRAFQYLVALKTAQRQGVKTYLINSVWQEMPDKYDEVLQKCDGISVREVFSQKDIANHGVNANVFPDLSYMLDVPYKEYEHVSVYEGQYIKARQDDAIGIYPRIDIFEQEWDEIVNRLRNADLLITGRHHEMYAACKAKCRFIVKQGNTWKNGGLLRSAGIDIPNNVKAILEGKYDEQYEQLWDYLEESTRHRERAFMD
jgi:polysaccharide pyruvyl transferase WcaK-like protein